MKKLRTAKRKIEKEYVQLKEEKSKMEELNNSQQVISTFFSDSLNDEDTESESDNSRNDNAQRGGEEEASGQSQYLFNCPETKKIRKDSL